MIGTQCYGCTNYNPVTSDCSAYAKSKYFFSIDRCPKRDEIIVKGGPGSGHFNHLGNPGHRGGSLPSKGGEGGEKSEKAEEAPKKPEEMNMVERRLRGIDYTDEQIALLSDQCEMVLRHGLETGNELLAVVNTVKGSVLHESGGDNYVVMTGSQKAELAMAERKSLVMIHNHPSGSAFSYDDITFFRDASLKTQIVVGHNGTTYIVSKGENHSPEGLIRDYQETYNYLFDVYSERVQAGEMTNDEARVEHTDKVMSRIAGRNGFKYEKVVAAA